MKLSNAKLKRLAEEATVDAYNESEQRIGFLTMIDDNLSLPFVTHILGVEVSVEKYFDAFFYLANWGTRDLMLRLPRRLLDHEVAQRYCCGDSALVRRKGEYVILEFRSEDGEVEDWVEGDAGLSALVPLRADLARGDHRCLYLAWLLCVQTGEIGDDAEEPPVRGGLRARYLNDLTKRETQAWTKVDQLIATRQPKKYGEAIALLCDLRELAVRDGKAREIMACLQRIQMQHEGKSTFINRLRKAGLPSSRQLVARMPRWRHCREGPERAEVASPRRA